MTSNTAILSLLANHRVEIDRKDKRIAELEKDIAFVQSCVNSGETAAKADRPSNQLKALKEKG